MNFAPGRRPDAGSVLLSLRAPRGEPSPRPDPMTCRRWRRGRRPESKDTHMTNRRLALALASLFIVGTGLFVLAAVLRWDLVVL